MVTDASGRDGTISEPWMGLLQPRRHPSARVRLPDQRGLRHGCRQAGALLTAPGMPLPAAKRWRSLSTIHINLLSKYFLNFRGFHRDRRNLVQKALHHRIPGQQGLQHQQTLRPRAPQGGPRAADPRAAGIYI